MTQPLDATRSCIVIGGGPAGLTAAHECARLGIPAIVFEQDGVVGGISRTVEYKGFRFDIGGHRFFTKVPVVREMWKEVLGPALLTRPRLSRIHYNDKFFDYPLKPANALFGLGVIEAARVGLSYLKAQILPSREEKNFEQWVSNRFGARLYEIFFKTYTEKVWGIPCTEISADWAVQRIKNLDLLTAVKNAFLGDRSSGGEVVTTLIEEFQYPRLGPGMMWERVRDLVAAAGIETVMRTRVTRIHHDGESVRSITLKPESGEEFVQRGAHFVSSMPIRDLLEAFDPPPPPDVLEAARRLRYRDFLTVGLIVDRPEIFPDNWIYVHSPKVRVGRIQNFRNWSPDMVPDSGKSSIGLEYFVQEGDELWGAPDCELLELAKRECAQLGLIREDEVSDGVVIRMPKAYPVSDHGLVDSLAVIRRFLDRFENLQLVGRNGQHRYNNQDHSMLTAIYAVENIAGANRDVWDVNVEEEYHEAVNSGSQAGDRLVPEKLTDVDRAVDALRAAFARYDPVALGGAVGIVAGLGLFLATAALLVRGGDPVGPTLSLLGRYLFGFEVTWVGAFVGFAEAAILGCAFGSLLALSINAMVSWQEHWLVRRLELQRALDGLDEEIR